MQYYTNPYVGTNTYPSHSVNPIPQNTFAWIQGEESARSYPVAPGNTVVLIDSDKPIMYMKTTDFSGKPQPMQIRYLVSKEEYEKIQNGGKNSPNLDEYVTKETFEKYINEANNKFALKRRDK